MGNPVDILPPAAWVGHGPVEGLLIDPKFTVGTHFNGFGKKWGWLPDAWGNEWCVIAEGYDFSRDPTPDKSNQDPAELLAFSAAAQASWQQTTDDLMHALGWEDDVTKGPSVIRWSDATGDAGWVMGAGFADGSFKSSPRSAQLVWFPIDLGPDARDSGYRYWRAIGNPWTRTAYLVAAGGPYYDAGANGADIVAAVEKTFFGLVNIIIDAATGNYIGCVQSLVGIATAWYDFDATRKRIEAGIQAGVGGAAKKAVQDNGAPSEAQTQADFEKRAAALRAANAAKAAQRGNDGYGFNPFGSAPVDGAVPQPTPLPAPPPASSASSSISPALLLLGLAFGLWVL